jgi:hypothetical protein
MHKVALVPKTASGVLDPLDPGIDGFATGVGDAVSKVSDDAFESAFEHTFDMDQ